MVYIGDTPRTTSFASVVKDAFSGDGSETAFTLSKIATTNSVSVFVENVRQEPTTAYSVSGTTLTFTAAPVTSSGNNIYVLHMNPTATATHPSAQDLTAANANFTGAVTGTAMVHLLSATISSAVSAYDISSTHINSTYDSYFITGQFLPATDNVALYLRLAVGGSVQTGSIYGREVASLAFSGYGSSNASAYFALVSYYNIGNEAGEGITMNATLQNVNNTARACCVSGFSNGQGTSGVHVSTAFSGSLIKANTANVVNGLRFLMSSGNIASGSVKLYGIKD